MKIVLNRPKCVSLGVCESVSPVFEMDEDSDLVIHEDLIPSRAVEELREAVQSCPVKALALIQVSDAAEDDSNPNANA